MSVWHDIDKKLAQYKSELEGTRNAVRDLGGAYVRADEWGWWRCSYRPTVGDRLRVQLKARSPAELLEQLRGVKAVKSKPKRGAA